MLPGYDWTNDLGDRPIGFNAFFLRTTRGDGEKSSIFDSYGPVAGEIRAERGGVLVASEQGVAVTYGLLNAQGRGETFVDPGTKVYEGMVIGSHHREGDIEINGCKEKKLTNMRLRPRQTWPSA